MGYNNDNDRQSVCPAYLPCFLLLSFFAKTHSLFLSGTRPFLFARCLQKLPAHKTRPCEVATITIKQEPVECHLASVNVTVSGL